MPDVEVDFPRGGAPVSAPFKKSTEKSFSNKRKFASENESKLPTVGNFELFLFLFC